MRHRLRALREDERRRALHRDDRADRAAPSSPARRAGTSAATRQTANATSRRGIGRGEAARDGVESGPERARRRCQRPRDGSSNRGRDRDANGIRGGPSPLLDRERRFSDAPPSGIRRRDPRGIRSRLVPEVAAAGDDHHGAGLADRVEHLGVALRAARLDDRRDACLERDAAARRRTGRTRRRRARPPRGSARARGPCRRRSATASTRLIWPAPIPSVWPPAGDHDRVRGDVLGDRPREQEVVPRRGVGVAADDVHRVERVAVRVAVLDEQAAEARA